MHGQQISHDGDGVATTAAPHTGDSSESRQRALTLATERELRAPLRALRLLLEGRRGTPTSLTERAFVDRSFVERALSELQRAERAAADLVQWTSPRDVRAVPCTIAEITDALAGALDLDVRKRCHFVVENEDTRLVTDGRLVVETFARTIRHLVDPSDEGANEAMVHAHAEDGLVTISLVEGAAERADEIEVQEIDEHLSLAETLLERDLTLIGCRVSLHRTSGHRCVVVVFPRDAMDAAGAQTLGGAA